MSGVEAVGLGAARALVHGGVDVAEVAAAGTHSSDMVARMPEMITRTQAGRDALAGVRPTLATGSEEAWRVDRSMEQLDNVLTTAPVSLRINSAAHPISSVPGFEGRDVRFQPLQADMRHFVIQLHAAENILPGAAPELEGLVPARQALSALHGEITSAATADELAAALDKVPVLREQLVGIRERLRPLAASAQAPGAQQLVGTDRLPWQVVGTNSAVHDLDNALRYGPRLVEGVRTAAPDAVRARLASARSYLSQNVSSARSGSDNALLGRPHDFGTVFTNRVPADFLRTFASGQA